MQLKKLLIFIIEKSIESIQNGHVIGAVLTDLSFYTYMAVH